MQHRVPKVVENKHHVHDCTSNVENRACENTLLQENKNNVRNWRGLNGD